MVKKPEFVRNWWITILNPKADTTNPQDDRTLTLPLPAPWSLPSLAITDVKTTGVPNDAEGWRGGARHAGNAERHK